MEELQVEDAINAAIKQAAGTWRMTKGIYSIDHIETVSPSESLHEGILEQLPEWCIYINLQGAWGMHGVYVSLESDVKDGRAELRFLVDSLDELTPKLLHVGNWSVEEGLHRMGGEAQRVSFDMRGRVLPETPKDDIPLMTRLVGLVNYISDPATIISGNGKPGNPEPVKTKNGWKLFPRDKVSLWKVSS